MYNNVNIGECMYNVCIYVSQVNIGCDDVARRPIGMMIFSENRGMIM